MAFRKRRSVAPVIATLLMVAIAVVGGMLVFVFSQDFFTQTDSMTGPEIQLLQIMGYDARDVGNNAIKNHAGNACSVAADQGGTLTDGDAFSIHVRNLSAKDISIDDVRVFGVSATPGDPTKAFSSSEPAKGEWTLNVVDACAGAPSPTNVISPGRDASIFINYISSTSGPTFGDPVKVGRPLFIDIETGSGNVFTKTIISGRSR